MTTHHHTHTHHHGHGHHVPAHARPVVRDRIGEHRAHEARLITTALATVCGLGFTAAVVPAVEHAVTLAGVALLVLAGLGLAVRLGARWVRERCEDTADARTAARWRQTHAPHLLTPADRALLDQPAARIVTGVA
jgi:hypothetical protein